MASKFARYRKDGKTVEVDIEHLDTDSFSRSVNRAAMKWARSALVFRHKAVTLVDANYAHTSEGRNCTSTFTFKMDH